MKLLYSALFLVGCAGAQKEVAMQGSALDLVHIAGDWQGEYTGTDSGRSGRVSFSLEVGSHIAEGQVMMNGATPLEIAFVKVHRNEVEGTITPYVDPSCSCEVETSFSGTVMDNWIAGTFESTRGKTGQVQSGTWSVHRRPD